MDPSPVAAAAFLLAVRANASLRSLEIGWTSPWDRGEHGSSAPAPELVEAAALVVTRALA